MSSNKGLVTWCLMGLALLALLAVFLGLASRHDHQKYALFNAAQEGNLEKVKLLLSQGSHINLQAKDSLDWTPLIWAIYQHQTNVVEYLIKSGADVNIPDANGRTPLMWLTFWGPECVPYVKQAIAQGARLDAKDKRGMTVFEWAGGDHPDTELLKILEAVRHEQSTNAQN